MSVATARNGIGSRSKSLMPSALAVSSCRKSSRFAPAERALEPADLAVAESDLERQREARVALLVAEVELAARRRVGEQRGPADLRHDPVHVGGRHARSRRGRRRSSPSRSRRCSRPGICISSSTLRTPMCVIPRAPPPDSTSPIFGRLASTAAAGACAIATVAVPRAATSSKQRGRVPARNRKPRRHVHSGRGDATTVVRVRSGFMDRDPKAQ